MYVVSGGKKLPDVGLVTGYSFYLGGMKNVLWNRCS